MEAACTIEEAAKYEVDSQVSEAENEASEVRRLHALYDSLVQVGLELANQMLVLSERGDGLVVREAVRGKLHVQLIVCITSILAAEMEARPNHRG